MKVFVTKYALTSGIREIDSEISDNGLVKEGYAYYHAKDYVFTKQEADVRAKEMAMNKKASLLKNVTKLEKKFGV